MSSQIDYQSHSLISDKNHRFTIFQLKMWNESISGMFVLKGICQISKCQNSY